MNRVLVVLATIATILGTATATGAQATISSNQGPFSFQFNQTASPRGGPFSFQFNQTASPRGVAVEGWVYNALPWRITNVRVQVDSIDIHGTLVASALGWVLGDVAAGGRGYFYVPVAVQAPTYRPSVQRFDHVMLEAPAPQAP